MLSDPFFGDEGGDAGEDDFGGSVCRFEFLEEDSAALDAGYGPENLGVLVGLGGQLYFSPSGGVGAAL